MICCYCGEDMTGQMRSGDGKAHATCQAMEDGAPIADHHGECHHCGRPMYGWESWRGDYHADCFVMVQRDEGIR